jgi:adenylate cyclase class 2
MHYEVEQKFAIESFADVETRVSDLGGEFDLPVEQVDSYYAHPVRDFAKTDEALRIRRIGESARVTYKGPRIDGTTKTRREIEIPLGGGGEGDSGRQFAAMLDCLGFRLVAEVVKQRRSARLIWQDVEIEIALDDVRGAGTFVELETTADEQTVDQARQTIAALARRLNLSAEEHRSYLELLLERNATPPQ